MSHTNYTVIVKAMKALFTPDILRCFYYYYVNRKKVYLR